MNKLINIPQYSNDNVISVYKNDEFVNEFSDKFNTINFIGDIYNFVEIDKTILDKLSNLKIPSKYFNVKYKKYKYKLNLFKVSKLQKTYNCIENGIETYKDFNEFKNKQIKQNKILIKNYEKSLNDKENKHFNKYFIRKFKKRIEYTNSLIKMYDYLWDYFKINEYVNKNNYIIFKYHFDKFDDKKFINHIKFFMKKLDICFLNDNFLKSRFIEFISENYDNYNLSFDEQIKNHKIKEINKLKQINKDLIKEENIDYYKNNNIKKIHYENGYLYLDLYGEFYEISSKILPYMKNSNSINKNTFFSKMLFKTFENIFNKNSNCESLDEYLNSKVKYLLNNKNSSYIDNLNKETNNNKLNYIDYVKNKSTKLIKELKELETDTKFTRDEEIRPTKEELRIAMIKKQDSKLIDLKLNINNIPEGQVMLMKKMIEQFKQEIDYFLIDKNK